MTANRYAGDDRSSVVERTYGTARVRKAVEEALEWALPAERDPLSAQRGLQSQQQRIFLPWRPASCAATTAAAQHGCLTKTEAYTGQRLHKRDQVYRLRNWRWRRRWSCERIPNRSNKLPFSSTPPALSDDRGPTSLPVWPRKAVRKKQSHLSYLEALLEAEVEERDRRAVIRRIKEGPIPAVKDPGGVPTSRQRRRSPWPDKKAQ